MVAADQIRIVRLDDIRRSTIAAMLRLFDEFTQLLTVVDEQPRWCKFASYQGPHRCESMILGSIVFCLSRAKLFPVPRPEEINESVLSLYRKLSTIVVHDIGQGERKGSDHSECNPRKFLIDRLQRILADMAPPISDEHNAMLEAQMKKIGRGS